MMKIESTFKKIAVIFAIMSFVIFTSMLLYYYLLAFGYSPSSDEYVAELSCRQTSNPIEPIAEFSEMSHDKQRKVQRAIEEDGLVKINSSQKDYFEHNTDIRYKNQTYICEVVQR